MASHSVVKYVTTGAFFAVVGIAGTLGIGSAWCTPELGFSFWSDAERVREGYVLVAPYEADESYEGHGSVVLIDTKGRTVHEWETKYRALASYLQPNGTLWVAMTPPLRGKWYPSPGTTGLIQEIDWEGNILWEYADDQMTHDFDIMPDGGIAYTRWAKLPASFVAQVRGGIGTSTEVWSNEIVVVNRDKEIVWTWRPEDHLSPRTFVLSPLVMRHDWAHINSIRYTNDNPITHTPAFLMSARHLDVVLIVDAESGTILWQSPKGMFAAQHDATFLENGNILVFDNGLASRPLLVSKTIEVDPRTKSVVWNYPNGSSTAETIQFFSGIMGGAQRLTNGNTLVTESTENTIIEVTPAGDVVWSYTNYFRDGGEAKAIFKARKYSAEGVEWGDWLGAGFSPQLSCLQ